MLSKIRINGLGMNVKAETPSETGESFVDVVVDAPPQGGDRVVLMSQRVDISGIGEIVVGFLVIALKSGNRWFLINPKLIN